MSESKKEFLTYILGTEEFAVEISRVQEIRGWEKPSPLPSVPHYVKGVIDIRGTVVPIIDLRDRFHLEVSYNATTVVIVVHILTSTGERVVGLVVDAVSDVHVFDLSSLQASPDISDSIDNQFVLGLSTIYEADTKNTPSHSHDVDKVSKKKSRMVILVDIDLLANEGLLEQVSHAQEGQVVGNG
jgi:purine-binding chemotaxis protein CheW